MARSIMVGTHLDGLMTGVGDIQASDLAGAAAKTPTKGKLAAGIRNIIKIDRQIKSENGHSFINHPKGKRWKSHMSEGDKVYIKSLKGKRRKGKKSGSDDDSEGVGDLPMLPVWTGQDRETWEPHSLGDFRTSEAYSGRGMHRHYKGEAIPFMVGSVDEAGLFGSKKRKEQRAAEEAAKAEAAASEGLAYIGQIVRDSSGDLSMLPVWTGQDRETWEPHGAGDFRTSEVYSGRGMHRHYKGEAIPFMVGDIDVGYRDAWRPQGIGDPPDSAVYDGDAIPYMEGMAAAARSEGLVYLGNIRGR